jgi:hypothetical protein
VSFDQGGAVSFFVHELGFGSGIGSFSVQAFTNSAPASQFFSIVGQDVAYGIRPVGIAARPLRAVGIEVSGIAIVLNTDGNLFDVVNAPNFPVEANSSRTYSYEISVARDLGAVRGNYLIRDGDRHVTLSGQLINAVSRLPATDYAFLVRDAKVESVVPLDEEGRFSAEVPPGTYQVLIDTPSRNALGVGPVDVQSNTEVTIDAGAHGHVNVSAVLAPALDRADTSTGPCRLTIFSDVAPAAFATGSLRAGTRDAFDVRYLRDCTADLALPEGAYLFQLSAGPAFDVIHERVIVAEGADAKVTGTLHRIFSASVQADFHQHTIHSPDSNVPLELRALGYAAEGIDFFSSSDHDHISDYAPVIASLGLQDRLAWAPGIETTTFTYGHFNAWPLPIDRSLPNGGSIDWGRESNSRFPRDIFALMRERGAAVIQVNHPRGTNAEDFQAFFDRAGLIVDPDVQMLGSDPLAQPVSNTLLRLPEGQPIFDRGFDAVELLNGFGFSDTDGDGRLDEYRANITLRDVFGFLAQGFKPTMVGVSDSHSAYNTLIGYPRTLVQSEGTDAESVAAALKAGRAVATNSPLLHVQAIGLSSGSLGALVASDGTLTLEIRSEAQTQAQIDRFEVFVNTWSRSPALTPTGSRQLSSITPTETVSVAAVPVMRPNGGTVYIATASVPISVTKDAFVVVRATGTEPLFPFLLAGRGTPNPAATSAADFFAQRSGPPAIAVSNPIFIDRDGDGVYHPPALP